MKVNQSLHDGAKRILLPVFLLFALLQSCGNEEELIPTTLRLTITNAAGVPQSQMNVSLYLSKQDWLAETNEVTSDVTGSDGTIDLTSIEANTYYVNVQNGNTTNWDAQTFTVTVEANKINEQTILVTSSNSHYLTGKMEQSWSIVDARLQGTSLFAEVDACEKDNVFFYQREGKTGALHFGQNKCTGEVGDQELFTWSFDTNETQLTITSSDGTSQTFKILSLTASTMSVEIPTDFEGQLVPIEFVFSRLNN